MCGSGTLQTHGKGATTPQQDGHHFPLRLVVCWLAEMLLNLWDASVPDVLYTFFGNHYYLLNKWATTLTGWRDFQQCSMPAQNDKWRSHCSATNDAKIYTTVYSHFKNEEKKNRLWQLKAIKWNRISPCLRKTHCDIWNALFFTNVIDHWL